MDSDLIEFFIFDVLACFKISSGQKS